MGRIVSVGSPRLVPRQGLLTPTTMPLTMSSNGGERRCRDRARVQPLLRAPDGTDARWLRHAAAAEARVIYELGHDVTEVGELKQRLDIDAGQLSRMLGRLEAQGLVERSSSPTD